MRGGITINEYISKFLLSSEELLEKVTEENIIPLTTPPTNFPFVVYFRTALDPEYTKDGWARDKIKLQITVVSKFYDEACEIAQIIRELLEWKTYRDENIFIKDIILLSADEDFSENSFIQDLLFELEITD